MHHLEIRLLNSTEEKIAEIKSQYEAKITAIEAENQSMQSTFDTAIKAHQVEVEALKAENVQIAVNAQNALKMLAESSMRPIRMAMEESVTETPVHEPQTKKLYNRAETEPITDLAESLKEPTEEEYSLPDEETAIDAVFYRRVHTSVQNLTP